MAGRSAVDSDGGAGLHESGDRAGDRGLLGCPDRGARAVGGGAADDRPTVHALQLSGLVELGKVAADGHAGDAEPLRQLAGVDLTGVLQRLQYFALTSPA